MEKVDVVASLGQLQLLRPARVRSALAANDRLKLYLTVLQTARTHADKPSAAHLDLSHEFAAAQVKAPWLHDLPANAYRDGTVLHLPDLPRVAGLLRDDLGVMARPLVEGDGTPSELAPRVARWSAWLEQLTSDGLAPDELRALTNGNRHGDEDSFHLLVMDLHKALNRLAAELSDETIDGAHVWALGKDDRARVAAFMRGINRTRGLKLNHPGLDTAATRDGARLLLQNDIGTNDAHVLVIQVEDGRITLTYSDLHRRRFGFFQSMLAELGAQWSTPELRSTEGLNAGDAYEVGTATFDCAGEDALQETLEAVGARIVFLIDWNRARKRLELLVTKADALAVLTEGARREVGHMGWLACGGERLVFGAMQALGPDYFQIGDRLDQVLGSEQAREFLVQLLSLCVHAVRERQSVSMVADDARLLLMRGMRPRDEFELLNEHAAYCHALAEALRDGLAHGVERNHDAARKLAARAKEWEHQADQLVTRARTWAEQHQRWQPFATLIESADDVADALEEAAFLLTLIADDHHDGWHGEVRQVMQALADAVLGATQDHVKALAIAGALDDKSNAEDQEAFVAALWRVLNAERQCDVLLREARRALAAHIKDAAALTLATDFAGALEMASDVLLATGYQLRRLTFNRAGVGA